MLITIALIAAFIFAAYAYFTQSKNTLPGDPFLKRVWVSIVAAAGAIITAGWSWLHSVTGP